MQFRKHSGVTEAFVYKSFMFFRSSEQSSPAALLSTDSQSWKLSELRKDLFSLVLSPLQYVDDLLSGCNSGGHRSYICFLSVF